MDEVLRKVQKVQYEMLCLFDEICRTNHLKYSLYAGTMLGAIRHQGFIPWDDDLDVCMPRKDYNQFIKAWNEINPDGFVLQNKNTDSDFTQSFSKLRKDNSIFFQENDIGRKYHTGIYIDIFPADRIPIGHCRKIIFKIQSMKYNLFIREFIPPSGNIIVKVIAKYLLLFYSKKRREKYRIQFEKKLLKYDDNYAFSVVFLETLDSMRVQYPPGVLDNYIDVQFESKKFMCAEQYDSILKLKYGDYMKLPAESERTWRHKPLEIDFEHNK